MKKPNFYVSLIPVVILIVLLIVGVIIFGSDLTSGPSQVIIITSSMIVIGISMIFYKTPWQRLEDGMSNQLKNTGSAIFILMMIGALTATWMVSGIVPSLIYYGLKIIHPSIFLAVAFILSTLVSLLSGSSWTTCGTIGVALISAGSILGIHEGWLAGAIISGAYFGDKRSPLSDTCNLSASVAEVDLYKHIDFLRYTNIPSFIISLIIFVVVGFILDVDKVDVPLLLNDVTGSFNVSIWFLLIPAFTIFLIYKKVSPLATLFVSAVMGAILAFFAQPHLVSQIYGEVQGGFDQFVCSSFKMMSTDITIDAGNDMMSELASTSGMKGMMNTISLILSVIIFGGALNGSGMIEAITDRLILLMKGTTSVVTYTILTGILCNLTLSDQYMAILLPGKMFGDTYKKKGLAPEMLSRTIEDSSTVTSVLVPWNTCGVTQSTVLGVATLTYLPYCIYNIISPFMSIFVASINWNIHRINTKDNGNSK